MKNTKKHKILNILKCKKCKNILKYLKFKATTILNTRNSTILSTHFKIPKMQKILHENYIQKYIKILIAI